MSKWVVDIYGEIEGDYEIIKKYEEPKTGKWLAKSFHEVYCDNCKFDFDIMTNEFIDKMNYCPNCGAKIESEEQNGIDKNS